MGIVKDRLDSLFKRKSNLYQGGGEEAQRAVKISGKFTARGRIETLLDPSSFVETGGFVKQRATDFNAAEKETPCDGVVTGFGSVNGRLVFVYSQDSTVLGGSVGEMHAKKICGVYKQAMKMGAPVIGFVDSNGVRVQEGVDALDAYGMIYSAMSAASGVIPQITAVMGGCMGGAAFIPALSDFVLAVEKSAKLFLTSPRSAEGDDGKKGEFETETENNSLVHLSCEGDAECIDKIKSLLDFLPSNNIEDAPYAEADDINRVESALNAVIPEDLETPMDVKGIISSLADSGIFMELGAKYAENVETGFIHMAGATVGVIANNGDLCSCCIDKATRFVAFCDSFNIPILTLSDAGGYSTQVSQDGVIRSVARLANAFASATVPKVNVIMRKAFGNAYVMMNSKHVGADMVFAWPTAQIGAMNPEAAARIMYGDDDGAIAEKVEKYKKDVSSPYVAAARGYVDDIIEPSATRKRVIAAFEMLATKREGLPAKKHSSVMF